MRVKLFILIILLICGCITDKDILEINKKENKINLINIYSDPYIGHYSSMELDEPFLYIASEKKGLWRANIRSSFLSGQYIIIKDSIGDTLSIYDIDAHENNLVVASNKGVFFSEDFGNSWYDSDLKNEIFHVERSIYQPDTLITSSNGFAIYQSIDAGMHWNLISGNPDGVAFLKGLYWSPYNSDEVWINVITGWYEPVLYSYSIKEKNKKIDINLEQLFGNTYLSYIYRVSFNKIQKYINYFGIRIDSSSFVLKSEDSGLNWKRINPNNIYVHDFVIDSRFESTFYFIGKEDKKVYLYQTQDEFLTATRFGYINSANDYFEEMLLDTLGNQLFIGTPDGVYKYSIK